MAKRSFNEAFLKLGFTELDGKPKCVVCLKVLSAESMKKNKLQRHLEKNHANYVIIHNAALSEDFLFCKALKLYVQGEDIFQ